ncbi:MAG: hypothetical protein K0R10_1516 [Alphaproteobacteria bacterium]|jgi:hypothetical protein|nr:hypothetical protein [Alphaproteobacteria bacterium]
MQTKKPVCASVSEIRNILGPSDDDLIMAIQNTGATREEVLLAFQWLEGEDPGNTARKSMTEKIRSVYDLIFDSQTSPEQS